MPSLRGARLAGVEWADRVWGWLVTKPRRGLLLALGISCALRLPFLRMPFGADEGGYLYVARQWSGEGHWLYGDQWVDRPPVLIGIFKAIALLGGTPWVMRVVAMAVAGLLVVSVWSIGTRLAGAQGGCAAALCAAGLGSNPAIDGNQLISDQVGAAFTAASVAVLFAATARWLPGHGARAALGAAGLAGAAGTLGSCGFLSKQSALLGLVMGAVILCAHPRRNRALFLAYGTGAVMPLAATLGWASAGPGVGMLVNALYTFRADSVRVVSTASSHAPMHRAGSFLGVAASTGIAMAIVHLGYDMFTRRGDRRLRGAIMVAAVTLAAVILASLNWYSYYWLAVVPFAAVGTSLGFMATQRRGRARLFPRLIVAISLLAAVINVAVRIPVQTTRPAVSRFIAASSRATDTMIVCGPPFFGPDLVRIDPQVRGPVLVQDGCS